MIKVDRDQLTLRRTKMKDYTSLIDIRCVTVLIAADLLGISRGLCYRLVHEGQIPSIRLGRRILIPVAALNEMLVRKGEGVRPCQSENEKPPTATDRSSTVKTGDGAPLSG